MNPAVVRVLVVAIVMICAATVSGQSGCSSSIPAIAGGFIGGMIVGLVLGLVGTLVAAVVTGKVLRNRHSAKDQETSVTYIKDTAVPLNIKENEFVDTGVGQRMEPPTMPAPRAPSPPRTAVKPKKRSNSTLVPYLSSSPSPLPPPSSSPTGEYDRPITNIKPSWKKHGLSDSSLVGNKVHRIRKSVSLEQLNAMGITNIDVEIEYGEGLARPNEEDYYIMDAPRQFSVTKSKSTQNLRNTAQKWEPPKYVNVGTHTMKNNIPQRDKIMYRNMIQ